MNLKEEFFTKLKAIIKSEKIGIDVPMKEHTYFKVGGPADILVEPSSKEELASIIALCSSEKMPYLIIGNGSNILVKDGGIRGVVIKLSALDKIEVQGERISAESGALLSDLSKMALEESLTGFEFACGIPGSVGGAVFMNAGAYDGELSYVIEEAEVIEGRQNKKIKCSGAGAWL